MANSLLRIATVMQRTGMAQSSIYARIKQGTFPRPISIGSRCVAWIESDITRWINEQIEASEND